MFHPGLADAVGDDCAVVVEAVGDFRPAVVFSSGNDIEFVTAHWSVFAVPYFSGDWIDCQALGIAVAIGVDGFECAFCFCERIVFGDASVCVDAMDFAVWSGQVLRLVLYAPVSDCKVEVSVCVEYDASAVVMPGCEIGFMGGFVDDFLIDPCVVPDVTAYEARHCRGPALPCNVGDFMAVGEVNPAIFRVVRVYCHVH